MKNALLVLWTSVALATSASFRPWPSSVTPQQGQETAITGTLDGWRLDIDGTVFLRVRHSGSVTREQDATGVEFTWFRTPPDRSDIRDVEARVLDIILASDGAAQDATVTVTTKVERSLKGSDLKDALPMLSITTRP